MHIEQTGGKTSINLYTLIKGIVSRDFFASGFFSWIIFHQAHENNSQVITNFSKIRGDIRKWTCTTGINENSGKFATGINDTGGKFCHQYRWCCWYCWQGNTIRLLTP